MNLLGFLLYTVLSTGLWAGLLAYLGRLLGNNYERVAAFVGPISYVVLGLVVLGTVIWVVRKRTQTGKDTD